MELKKSRIIIIAFVSLWIIFLGWGIIQTTLKLSKESPLIKKPVSQEPQSPKMLMEKMAEEAKTRPVLVRTFRVTRTDFSDVLPVMGTVKGEKEIELRFEINGVIKTIFFDEGERIKKGELIACLDPKDSQLKLEYTQNKLASGLASYQASLKKLEVHENLYQAGAIIKSRLEEIALECESAKFELATMKSETALSENELEKTNLYSGIDGVLGPREAEEGEFVTPQDPIASLLKISSVFIEVGIVERDINKLKLGQKAKVFVDAHPNITFEGIIDNIFPVVGGRSRTLTTKIKVNNPKELLLPGMFCRAEISIIELKDVLLIPSVCLTPTGEEIMIAPVIPAQTLITNEEEIQTGTVRLSRVNTGHITNDYAQITDGLEENDLVVIESRGELTDEATVQINAIEEISF